MSYGYVENKDFVMEWRFADGNYRPPSRVTRQSLRN